MTRYSVQLTSSDTRTHVHQEQAFDADSTEQIDIELTFFESEIRSTLLQICIHTLYFLCIFKCREYVELTYKNTFAVVDVGFDSKIASWANKTNKVK